jgi:hypothetical protein
MISPYVKNLVGSKFGKLIVTELSHIGNDKHACWWCRCKCGFIRRVRGSRLLDGSVRACSTCALKAGRKKQKASLRARYGDPKLTEMFHTYKCNARRKGYKFDLSKIDFDFLVKSACNYCGETPSNGVDRENNSVGYTNKNSVSCCSQCNYAKRDQNADVFFAWIEKVAKHNEGFLQR